MMHFLHADTCTDAPPVMKLSAHSVPQRSTRVPLQYLTFVFMLTCMNISRYHIERIFALVEENVICLGNRGKDTA